MEKQMDELYAKVKAAFPGREVSMGLGRNHYGDTSSWHIKLEGQLKDCPCCHQKTSGEIAVWSEPTFDDALAKIREMMKEKGGEDE